MKFKEYADKYLESMDNVTFLIAKAVKDESTPFYHPEYETTPIFKVIECKSMNYLLNMNILNDRQPPIDWLSGASWKNWFDEGFLKSFIVISDANLFELYSKKQADEMLKYIETQFK